MYIVDTKYDKQKWREKKIKCCIMIKPVDWAAE